MLRPKKVQNLRGRGVTAKNPRGVELLVSITSQSMKEVKNVQGLEKVEIEEALLSMMTFKAASMSMKASHANRAVASRGNSVLRHMKTMSSKKRVDPEMVELRSILLLEGNLGGACCQCVGGELERDDRVLKEGASPLPIT